MAGKIREVVEELEEGGISYVAFHERLKAWVGV